MTKKLDADAKQEIMITFAIKYNRILSWRIHKHATKF